MVTLEQLENKKACIAVVGLGYVGLPLAIQLAKHFSVLGFDIQQQRILDLCNGHDSTHEVSSGDLKATSIKFSSDKTILKQADVVIIAVPTPVDIYNTPDITPLCSATKLVAQHMPQGCVVVYESTVYPGLTEDICVPLLTETSGYFYGEDFTVGYSPERINPGDQVHTLASIVKIVSGSTPETTALLKAIYGKVVHAGIHVASSIKVAEAAKVIENTQRDLNIALMNELAIIFHKLGIDTLEVLEAAGTKWNFLPFRPGLVGGHCIGVDPYYLTLKAQEVGYHPEVILAGRRINDGMSTYIVDNCIKLLIKQKILVNEARIGVLGITFKENVPDLRNSKIISILNEFKECGLQTLVHDPLADPEQALKEYNIVLKDLSSFTNLDALILAVPHTAYTEIPSSDFLSYFKEPSSAVIMDLKSCLHPKDFSSQCFWRL